MPGRGAVRVRTQPGFRQWGGGRRGNFCRAGHRLYW